MKGDVSLLAAVIEVHASAFSESAAHYRSTMLADNGAPRIAITVQHLVNPTSAGVLFTRNPVTGAYERVVEASWGLGEAVVASLVTPDRFRFDRQAKAIEKSAGQKRLAISHAPNGGTVVTKIDDARSQALCLNEENIRQLNRLATQCENFFGGPQDIEWAIEADTLYLLQSRPITTTQKNS